MNQYLEFAKRLALEAEVIAARYFGFSVETTWKEDNTPLTQADKEINDLVIKMIRTTYPDHSIYGEEGSYIKDSSKFIWVCDPIDGTMAFSCGMPMFVFSLALVDQSSGQPVVGVINDPVMKNMYWACEGGGAYRNDIEIFASKSSIFKNTYALTGASGKDIGFSNLSFHKILSEKLCRVMKFPSFVYGAIQVANGKFSGGAFYGKYGHDVAALKIIIEESGGKVTDLNGNQRRYDRDGVGCLVSNGILHDAFLEIVQTGKI